MSLLNQQDNLCAPIPIPAQESPVPTQESPSQLIHHKMLNVRDKLDVISANVSEKLSPVMSNNIVPPETTNINTNPGLPPLFQQYDELIDHIGLVISDINLKLNTVKI